MKALEIIGKLREHFSDPKNWAAPSCFTLLNKVREITGKAATWTDTYPYLDLACQAKGMPAGDVGGFALRGDNAHARLMDMLSEATVIALNAGEK